MIPIPVRTGHWLQKREQSLEVWQWIGQYFQNSRLRWLRGRVRMGWRTTNTCHNHRNKPDRWQLQIMRTTLKRGNENFATTLKVIFSPIRSEVQIKITPLPCRCRWWSVDSEDDLRRTDIVVDVIPEWIRWQQISAQRSKSSQSSRPWKRHEQRSSPIKGSHRWLQEHPVDTDNGDGLTTSTEIQTVDALMSWNFDPDENGRSYIYFQNIDQQALKTIKGSFRHQLSLHSSTNIQAHTPKTTRTPNPGIKLGWDHWHTRS